VDDEASIRAMVYIFFWLLFVVLTTRSFQKDWVSVRRRLNSENLGSCRGHKFCNGPLKLTMLLGFC